MKLQTLKINMFKGIRSLEIAPDGQNLDIYGENGSGKTSIMDAMAWLLFDKSSDDRSPANFGIKTVDENGEPLKGAEHSVTGVFELEDRSTVSLKKIYQEKWVTKRGSHDSQLEGHTTSFYWDDEPVSQAKYKERIEQIMPEQLFKMLTLPNYFAEQMHWKDRRDILIDLCGEFTDEQIVSGREDLLGYPALLDGKTQEAREKILRERKKKLNEELNSIPDRIDENSQKITEPEQSEKQANEAIEILQANLAGKREKLSQAQSGGGVADLNVKVQEIEAEKAQFLNKHQAKVEESLKGVREKVSDLESKVDESEGQLRQAMREYKQVQEALENKERLAKQIADDIASEQQKQPDPKPEKDEGPETCPYCKQEMPKDEQDEDHENHYEQYLKKFNTDKAARLKELKEKLVFVQDQVEDLSAALKEKEQAGAKARSKDKQRKEALQKAKKELENQKENAPKADTEDFERRQKELLDKISEIKADRQKQVDGIKSEISELEDQIEGHRKVLRAHEFNGQLRARNQELRDMLKKYGQELNEVEQGLNLIEDFNRAKAEYITEQVNGLFDIVSWRLFKEQVNGGLQETADPVVRGVAYSEGLNNAARIQAGLDIIHTLSGHYGKSAPCFIDNAESIHDIPEYGIQLIALYVSEKDKSLRVEAAESKMAVA